MNMNSDTDFCMTFAIMLLINVTISINKNKPINIWKSNYTYNLNIFDFQILSSISNFPQ